MNNNIVDSNVKIDRYAIGYSNLFDNPDKVYDCELFKYIVKENGGRNIRLSYNYGWSNQPKVVTFSATDITKKQIEKALDRLLVFAGCGCLIKVKDW